jgi:(p)ppGpp synthase/HD superfamily hydrolase
MTALSRPRHPIVADALTLAGEWCRGQIIDGAPALGHAVKVALVLGRHVPDASPELVAAVLLHDSPEYAPKNVDLDTLLDERFGPAVPTIVRGLEREHIALGQRPVPDVTTEDRWTLYASAADKIVSLRSILHRASRVTDPAAYWQSRRAFVTRVPYFAAFHTAARPHLPPSMAGELARLVVRAEQATAP